MGVIFYRGKPTWTAGRGHCRLGGRAYTLEQTRCLRQDSSLFSRLRRGLLCTLLTSGNEFRQTMIGGVPGAARLRAALSLADGPEDPLGEQRS